MRRTVSVLLVFGLFSATLYADTDREVYDEADGIFKQAEEAVSTNLATFVQANEKPLAKAREEMAELIARMNKEGRSQLATSLQKRLNGLEETVQKRVRTEVPIVVPPRKPLLERLEGKWNVLGDKRHFRVYADGQIEALNDQDRLALDRARLNMLSPEIAEVLWSTNGWRNQFRMAGDDVVAVSEFGPSGERMQGFVLERIK